MPYMIGGHYAEQGEIQPSTPSAPEPPVERGERERRIPETRPGGGFMIGGNGGYALGSSN